jgi:hypothetical protein
MNVFDLNNDEIIMNIDGKDIEMKYPICYGKVYDKWLVSKCGKVWSLSVHRILPGHKSTQQNKNNRTTIKNLDYTIYSTSKDWWGDGSSAKGTKHKFFQRHIRGHKMIMDTWAPLYDNPPEGISWEEWEIARDLPTVYNHVSKTICIDHIDDDPTNNHLDNLRRVTSWDNNFTRKAKGI